jgi:hypothetical protein
VLTVLTSAGMPSRFVRWLVMVNSTLEIKKIQPRTKSEVLCGLAGEGLERYGSNERTLEVVGLDRCGYVSITASVEIDIDIDGALWGSSAGAWGL